MTPNPDSILPETTTLEALKQMHARKYLHLPVTTNSKSVVGMVDVLQLTYLILEQLEKVKGNDGSSNIWNQLFVPDSSQIDSSLNQSSFVLDEEVEHSVTDSTKLSQQSIKVKTPFGAIYLSGKSASSLENVVEDIFNRLPEVRQKKLMLSYEDQEGDSIFLQTQNDFDEMISNAAKTSVGKITLTAHIDSTNLQSVSMKNLSTTSILLDSPQAQTSEKQSSSSVGLITVLGIGIAVSAIGAFAYMKFLHK